MLTQKWLCFHHSSRLCLLSCAEFRWCRRWAFCNDCIHGNKSLLLSRAAQPLKCIHSAAELAFMFTCAMQRVDTAAGLSLGTRLFTLSAWTTTSAHEPLQPQRHTLHVLSICRVHPFLSCYKYPSELLWYTHQPTKLKRLGSAHVFSHSVCSEQMFEGENYFLSFLRLSWCWVKSPPCIMMNSELERPTVCVFMNSGTSMAIILKHVCVCVKNLHFWEDLLPDGHAMDVRECVWSLSIQKCHHVHLHVWGSRVHAQAHNHSVCSPPASCHQSFS